MNINIADLKAKARGNLNHRYATIIIAYMVARLLINIPSLLLSSMNFNNPFLRDLADIGVTLILTFISAIFIVGQNRMCLFFARTKVPIMVNEMWYGFKGNTDSIIITYFLIFIRMIISSVPFMISMFFLAQDLTNVSWMLASIITFFFSLCMIILISLDYALSLFLIVDLPDKNPAEILSLSKTLMRGHRIKYGLLQLSFIGMYILAILSFGIGFFWVYPYVRMTTAEFYLALTKSTSPALEGDPSDPNYYKEVY